MNPSGPGLFLVGWLLIGASTSALVIGYSVFRLLPGLGMGGCEFPGIYPFLPVVHVHRVICSHLWWQFAFLWNQWWSPLSFFIASIWLFSLFFFINQASDLSILFIFSKNQLLDLLIFWRFFLCVCISFSSALILAISCLLLAFEFVRFSSLVLLIVILGCRF